MPYADVILFCFFRDKIGGGKTSADHEHSKNVNKHRFGDSDKNKKDR